jgi:hypothetical protein
MEDGRGKGATPTVYTSRLGIHLYPEAVQDAREGSCYARCERGARKKPRTVELAP